MKILIAEDSALMRRVIVKVVTEKNHEPLESSNGAEVLAKLRKNESDVGLIILDWNMPLMSGYEALGKIRSQQKYDKIPVLMATADGVAEDVIKAIKAGANGYLVKPYTSESLSAKIDEMLEGV